jgi:hypothetical protein
VLDSLFLFSNKIGERREKRRKVEERREGKYQQQDCCPACVIGQQGRNQM